MANNVSVSVTADIADFTAKMAVAKATMQDTSKAMMAVAREQARGDQSDATATRMLQVSEAHSKAAATAAFLTREQKRMNMEMLAGVGITGQQRAGIQQLTYNLGDASTMYAMGAKTSQIFASQIGQTFQAVTLLAGETSKLGMFLSSGWGVAVQVGVMALVPLAGKLLETEQKMVDVKFAANAMGDAQSILGNVIDLTTGKVNTQSEALRTLAYAQLAVARVQAQVRQAEAQEKVNSYSHGIGGPAMFNPFRGLSAITGVGKPGPEMNVIRQLQGGQLTSKAAIKSLEELQHAGKITANVFGELAGAISAIPVEAENMKRLDKAEDFLEGNGPGGEFLKPKTQRKATGSKGPDQVSLWENELQQKQMDSEVFHDRELSEDLAFWKDKLTLTKQGSAQWLAVNDKIYDTTRAIAIKARRDALREGLAQNQQQMAISEEVARFEVEQARQALLSKMADVDAADRAGQLTASQAIQQRADLNQQLLKLDTDLEMRLYASKALQLRQDQSLYKQGTEQYADYKRRLELLEQQHQNRMADAKRQAAEDEKQRERDLAAHKLQIMRQTYQPYAQQIARMITLQQGFGATVKGIWSSLTDMVNQAVTNMVLAFITGLFAKEVASDRFHVKETLKSAKEAAANAWAATAKIPVIGPILAPAAAAAAFVGVMAFSAEGGMDVPGGAGPGVDGRGGRVGIVHPREMILPANLADAVRTMAANNNIAAIPSRVSASSMMSGMSARLDPNAVAAARMPRPRGAGPAATPGGMQGGGGDTHVHLHGKIIHGTREMKKFAESNAAQLSAAGRRYLRNNGRG